MTPTLAGTDVVPSAEPVAGPALDVLYEASPIGPGARRGIGMPAELACRYGGPLLVPLRPDRPTVVANFVETLDGIVALGSGALSGGGLVSGFHEPDRFVMALLRSLADVVVIGAGTLRGSTSHGWIGAHLQPDLAGELAHWRQAMGLRPQPTTIVVSGSGAVPVGHPGLNDPNIPVVIATTPSGLDRLRTAEPPKHVAIEPIGDGERAAGADIVDLVGRLGARLALCEGGPHLLAELVADDLVDELFLTIAPQLVGRDADRLGLVEGLSLPPTDARWQDLVSARRSGDHLFLRYRRGDAHPIVRES